LIIIKHRRNTIKSLRTTPNKYGIEIDLRSDPAKKNIYLHHNPFKKGVKLSKWIQFYNHKLLILNVKEEGLEKKILSILKKKNVTNFFFHDQTYSSMLKFMKMTKVSIRWSAYEEIKKKNYLFKYIKWLWIDNFKFIKIPVNFYKFLKKKGVKICLVSPELVKKKRLFEIKKIISYFYKDNLFPDAICTKKPNLWLKNLQNKKL